MVDARITTSASYGIWEAVVTCGLDLWKYEQGEYPPQFIAKVLAWHELNGLVKAHQEEAGQEAAERKAKAKKGR